MILIFILVISGLSYSYPINRNSNCLVVDKSWKFGINSFILLKRICLCSSNKLHLVKKCFESSIYPHEQKFVSVCPVLKLSALRKEFPTLIWVRRLHAYLLPLPKCLYFGGLYNFFNSVLKSRKFSTFLAFTLKITRP